VESKNVFRLTPTCNVNATKKKAKEEGSGYSEAERRGALMLSYQNPTSQGGLGVKN